MEGKKKDLWEPKLEHEGRPIDANNLAVSSTALAFDPLKALLLPLDMVEHNSQANSDFMKSALQSMVVANQKTYLAYGRYDKIE
ncbi:hypothetical protein CsSME_00031944 [Camellia sinensis var. sinensis]